MKNIRVQELSASPKYDVDTRVVVRIVGGYFIGTITKILQDEGEYTVLLDNGDVHFFRFRSSRILGVGVNRKTSKEINSSDLHKWLIDGWEAEVTKEIPNRISNFIKPSTPTQNYLLVANTILDLIGSGFIIESDANKLVSVLGDLKKNPLLKNCWPYTPRTTASMVKSICNGIHGFSKKQPGSITTKHRRAYQALSNKDIVSDFCRLLCAKGGKS